MASDDGSGSRLGAAAGLVRRRSRLLLAAAALLGLGFLGAQAWKQMRGVMRNDPRYRITAENIDTPPAPPWIRSDIRLEVLRDAELQGDLSILDPPNRLEERLADAFSFHPWVERVEAVRKVPPNRVAIELTFRRPLAAVAVHGQGFGLAPVDRQGFRLPLSDFTDAELRRLPRVIGVNSTTRTGEAWGDARVQGAVSLISALGQHWGSLELVDVIPSQSPEVHADRQYFVYDLMTRGRTRIVWGAAPNLSPPGESQFAEKLLRLQDYVREHGPLATNSLDTPERLDIRTSVVDVKQRTAKAGKTRTANATDSSAAEASNDEEGVVK